MAVEDDSDRFALLDDFGVQVKIKGITITAIFDNGWIDANGIESTEPALTARTIDIENFSRGDTAFVGNDEYTIAEFHKDGTGMAIVVLEEV